MQFFLYDGASLVVLSLKGIQHNTILQGTESLYAAELAVMSAERVLITPPAGMFPLNSV